MRKPSLTLPPSLDFVSLHKEIRRSKTREACPYIDALNIAYVKFRNSGRVHLQTLPDRLRSDSNTSVISQFPRSASCRGDRDLDVDEHFARGISHGGHLRQRDDGDTTTLRRRDDGRTTPRRRPGAATAPRDGRDGRDGCGRPLRATVGSNASPSCFASPGSGTRHYHRAAHCLTACACS